MLIIYEDMQCDITVAYPNHYSLYFIHNILFLLGTKINEKVSKKKKKSEKKTPMRLCTYLHCQRPPKRPKHLLFLHNFLSPNEYIQDTAKKNERTTFSSMVSFLFY